MDNENAVLSIGGLARASGVPVETIRNWEKRYGFPEALRRSSGHRRYSMIVISKLKLIRQALDMGFKPSFAVTASEGDLRRAIQSVVDTGATNGTQEGAHAFNDENEAVEIGQWMNYVERLDGELLETGFCRSWSRLGARDFITRMMVPFLREVGDRWSTGDVNVLHEHFASETLQNFIASQWRPIASRASGPRVVLAAFEGEFHALGLHMAAVYCGLQGYSLVFLGPNTPTSEIVKSAGLTSTAAVIVGAAASSDLNSTAHQLGLLREHLGASIPVIFGGNNDVIVPDGVQLVESIEDLETCLKDMRS